jgi:hypothetical protein
MSKEIRLKYSGLVIFMARVVSIFTGLAFSVVLTHSLTKPEFGAWTNIAGVLATFGIASGVFPFWAARYTARKFEGAMKLGVLANSLIAVPVAILVVLIGPTLATAANTSTLYYFFAAIIVIQSYIIVALDNVVAVTKTHVIGYAFLTFEVIKLTVGVPLLIFFHLGISAALLAIFIANIGWTIIYASVLGDWWAQKIKYQYLIQWIKGSFLNFYGVGASLLAGLEGYILLFRGGSVALAYFGAAALVAGPIGYTIYLSAALYPKLLAGGTFEDAESLLRMSLLFAIPLTVATIALSASLLAILNLDYAVAATILSLLALRGLASVFTSIFDAIIGGTEKLDANGRVSAKQAIRSRIFQSTSIGYLVYPIYLPVLWTLLQPYGNDAIGAARVTAMAGLVATLASGGLKYLISRRSLFYKFPILHGAKFLIVSSVLVSAMLFVHQPLTPLLTVGVFGIGAGLYFLILYYLDSEAKVLLKAIFEYFMDRVGLIR